MCWHAISILSQSDICTFLKVMFLTRLSVIEHVENSTIFRMIICVVFLFCFSASCVVYVASFPVFSIFDCLFGIL